MFSLITYVNFNHQLAAKLSFLRMQQINAMIAQVWIPVIALVNVLNSTFLLIPQQIIYQQDH